MKYQVGDLIEMTDVYTRQKTWLPITAVNGDYVTVEGSNLSYNTVASEPAPKPTKATEILCWAISSRYRKAVRDDRRATKALIAAMRRG